ncbi:MAG TPA: DUF3306 domain-containing protein [Burkholderiaceae bacterium]|nr:DUF3306 domain-containing protein [Burkholderiaceae bacterium]
MSADKGFLSRWAQRKAAVREGRAPAEPPPAAPAVPAPANAATAAPVADATADPKAVAAGRDEGASPAAAAPAPTLDDVAQLARDSDYRAFVAQGVDPQVRNAALKKLFTDPHFNVMDGLDVYIDDYGKPDPLPASMLRQLAQSKALGLFADEDAAQEAAAARQLDAPAAGADPDGAAPSGAAQSAAELPSPSPVDPAHDDDAAVRLQPDDAAGPRGAADRAEPDAGRQR